MFKDLANWSNKKLRASYFLATLSVILLSYLAPMATILAMCWSGTGGGKWKLPITAITIFCFFVFSLTHFLKKNIERMSIYDIKSQTAKHILEAVSKLIVPLTIIVLSALFATWLKEQIDFYNQMIMVCVGFYCSGVLVDRLWLGFLQDEKSIREKAKEANAVDARRQIVK